MIAVFIIIALIGIGFLAGLVVGVSWAMSWVRKKIAPALPPDHCPVCWPFDCGCRNKLSASEEQTQHTKPTADDVATKDT